jgi:Flp pilus assembly secretin CpaC
MPDLRDSRLSAVPEARPLNRWFTNPVHDPLNTFAKSRCPEIEMALSRSFLIATALLSATAFASPALADAGIEVTMNQARIVKLARAADTIVVGNPLIADAAVQDASTIVLTGKGFGVTNLVVLDKDGSPIIDEQVTVTRQNASTVRIYRRSQVQTMSCTPYCESSFKSEAERTSEMEMNTGN